jgi:hypothetical protein
MKPPSKTGKKQGLTRVAELLPGFEELAPVLQEQAQTKAVTVQGKHHFNRFKQIEALYQIGEGGEPDMGFMTRLLTLCSLPRTDPGDRLQYVRKNGPYKLVMMAGGDNKLPFGNLPRLLLAWVCNRSQAQLRPQPRRPGETQASISAVRYRRSCSSLALRATAEGAGETAPGSGRR